MTVIPNALQQRLQRSMVITNVVMPTKSCQAPSNNDLPAGSVQMFTTCFVPILQKYVGSLQNPWVTEGLVTPMQYIWDHVMQDWPHTFDEDNDKIYRLVIGHPLLLPTADLTTIISALTVHAKNLQLVHTVQ